MAKQLYAWTNFPVEFSDWGTVTKTINTGDEIRRGDIECSDEEWEEYLDRGLVRPEPYPDTPASISPLEHENQPEPLEGASGVIELRLSQLPELPEPMRAAKEHNPNFTETASTGVTASTETETSQRAVTSTASTSGSAGSAASTGLAGAIAAAGATGSTATSGGKSASGTDKK